MTFHKELRRTFKRPQVVSWATGLDSRTNTYVVGLSDRYKLEGEKAEDAAHRFGLPSQFKGHDVTYVWRVPFKPLSQIVPPETPLDPLPEPPPSTSYDDLYRNPLTYGSRTAHAGQTQGIGTYSGIVWDAATGEPLLLSAQHVWDENMAMIGTVGQEVYSPAEHAVYRLGRTIRYGASMRHVRYGRYVIDAAVAKITNPDRKFYVDVFEQGIPGVHRPSNGQAVIPLVGDQVEKYGVKTGHTEGVVDNFTVIYATYLPPGGQMRIIEVLEQPSFSSPGDSGSRVIRSSDNAIIGILVASNQTHTAVVRIDDIEDALGVSWSPVTGRTWDDSAVFKLAAGGHEDEEGVSRAPFHLRIGITRSIVAPMSVDVGVRIPVTTTTPVAVNVGVTRTYTAEMLVDVTIAEEGVYTAPLRLDLGLAGVKHTAPMMVDVEVLEEGTSRGPVLVDVGVTRTYVAPMYVDVTLDTTRISRFPADIRVDVLGVVARHPVTVRVNVRIPTEYSTLEDVPLTMLTVQEGESRRVGPRLIRSWNLTVSYMTYAHYLDLKAVVDANMVSEVRRAIDGTPHVIGGARVDFRISEWPAGVYEQVYITSFFEERVGFQGPTGWETSGRIVRIGIEEA